MATLSNFAEVIPGFYYTQDGQLAEVVQVMDKRLQDLLPARGLVGGSLTEWTLGGFCYGDGRFQPPLTLFTFIGTKKPLPEKAKLTYWVNVYNRVPDSAIYTTRDDADNNARTGRSACVELTGEYEMEETKGGNRTTLRT
jgi:hypothetical protein